MQAVILAAGRGTRMGALTAELPKPMLTVGRKTLLEHKLETLSGICDEVIIVVGYYGDMIRDHLGSEYSGVPIRYVTQEVLDGTGGAIVLARPFLTDRFVVLMGDDLYSRDDVERVCAKSDWALLIEKTEHMGAGGSMTLDANGSVTGIEEGNHRGKQGIMCTNMHLLDARFFTYPMVPKAEGSTEYSLPHTAVAASVALGIPFRGVDANGWIQVTAPEDLVLARQRLGLV